MAECIIYSHDDGCSKEFNFILGFIEDGDFEFDIQKYQLRALWTSFCLRYGLDPGTRRYDNYTLEMWYYLEDNLSNPWSSVDFKSFYFFMGNLLC